MFVLLEQRSFGYSSDHEIKRLMLRNFRCVITHEDRNLADVKLSKDGATIVSGYSDGTIRIWNICGANLQLISTVRTENPATTVAISEGGTVISCHQNGAINEWDIKGINISRTSLSDEIILVSQNGNIGIVGFVKPMGMFDSATEPGDYYLRGIYNLKTKAKIATPNGKTSWSNFAISQNGNAAVFFGLRGVTAVWTLNPVTNQTLWQDCTRTNCRDVSLCSAISECGRIVISGNVTPSNASCITVWDRYKDSYLNIPCLSPPNSLMIQDNIITSGHFDGTICVWTFDTFRQSYECLFTSSADDKHSSSVERLSIASDNMTILSCDRNGFIKIWQPQS